MNVKLTNREKRKVHCSLDVFKIMQQVLLRENKVDRDREHFWVLSLNNGNQLLNLELVSMGTVRRTVVEPMEIFSIPLQKRAVQIILVHNHPSGELKPSRNDELLTDQLIQCGRIMQVTVVDHLIISTRDYYSFKDGGLMDRLEQSQMFVPDYIRTRELRKQVEEVLTLRIRKSREKEIAKKMKEEGIDPDLITKITGLSKQMIGRIKI